MKLRKIIAGVVGTAMMVPMMAMTVMAANTNEIPIDEAHFPDPNFREYILEVIDYDGNGKLSEEERDYRDFNLTDVNLTSLEGIEYFENLTELDCDYSHLTSLDLSKNTKLEKLNCEYNQLTSLNVSNNTALYELICSNNQLTSLNVSGDTALVRLDCSNNQLTSLDVSNNIALDQLYCNSNQLTSLDVGNNVELVRLLCSNNQLTRLDVSNNAELSMLDCSDNRIMNLDVSRNTELFWLFCSNNRITSLNLRNNTDLDMLVIEKDLFDINTIASDSLHRVYSEGARNEPEYLIQWGEYEGLDNIDIVYSTSEFAYDEWNNDLCIENNDYTAIILVQSSVTLPESPVSGVEGFAERLYTCALDRESEQAGKDYWADALRHGTTGADAAYGFLFSEEVANANLTDEAFINRLYATLMDREPAEAEVEYWGSEIAAGRMTRQDVFSGFINSEEWANVCVTYGILSGGTGVPSITVEPSQAILDFATRLYTTCLNREADQAGLEWWAGELANLRTTGSAAAQSYFFSEEFINANVNDREFVNRLYLTFMNRDAADGEFDYWLGEMGNGMTRETVFSGFALSEEFGNICAEYGIIR